MSCIPKEDPMSGPVVGHATLNILPSTNGFGKALDAQIAPLGRSSANSAVGRDIGGGIMAGFKGLVGPAMLATAGVAVASFAKGAITAASNLQQSTGAVEAIFKGQAKAVEGFAAASAKSIGLSKNEYQELASVMGTQLRNGGTALSQLGTKTNSLIGTGADLSAMFGGTTREAVEALSSALKGERDPIERYGVSLTQAAVDAEAAHLGFKKVGGTLSTEANQAATLSLIMKQTADAHGAAAREADSFASRQQQLAAGWDNVKAAIGNAFLPIAANAVGMLSNLVNAAGPLVKTIGPQITGFFSSMAPAFAPVGAALLQLGKAALELGPNVSPMLFIFNALRPVLPTIAGLLAQVATILATTLTTAAQALTPIIQVLTDVIGTVLAAVLPVVSSLLSSLSPVLSQAGAMFKVLAAAVLPLVSVLADILKPVIEALMPVVKTVFGVIANVVKAAMTVLSGVIKVVTSAIKGDWSGVWQGVQQIFRGVWDAIKAVVVGAINIVRSVITAGVNIISTLWSATWGAVKGFFSGIWEGIKTAASNAISGLIGIVTGIKDKVLGALSGAGKWLWDAGKNIVQGLLNGIRSLGATIGNLFLSLLPGWIVGPFKAALGIHSPSRLFKSFGEYIGQGLVQGLVASQDSVVAATTALSDKIKDTFEKLADERKAAADKLVSLNEKLAKSNAAEVSARQSAAFRIGEKEKTLAKQQADAAKLKAQAAKADKKHKAAADKAAKAAAERAAKTARSLAQDKRVEKERQKTAASRIADIKKDIAAQKATIKADDAMLKNGSQDRALKLVDMANDRLAILADQRDAIIEQLKDASKALEDALKVRDDYASSVKGGILGLFNVANFHTSAGMTDGIRSVIDKTREFTDVLAKLKAARGRLRAERRPHGGPRAPRRRRGGCR